jgi:hypothetical protein
MKNGMLITEHYEEWHDAPKKQELILKIEYLKNGLWYRAPVCGKKLRS